MAPDEPDRADQRRGPARARRRRLPDGTQAEPPAGPGQAPEAEYLVVNADESEPGAFKDREIMRPRPHRLIEGCLIVAHAIQSTHVFIYIRGEYLAEYEILAPPSRRRGAGVFGDVEVVVHRGAGAYICGEESALLESLEGARAAAAAAAVPAGGGSLHARRRWSTTSRRSRASRRSSSSGSTGTRSSASTRRRAPSSTPSRATSTVPATTSSRSEPLCAS